MIKALIIDDEQYCLDALETTIKRYCPDIDVVGTCLSGVLGLESIEKYKPQLVFLDIAMPKMDGFEMLNELDNIDFEVIFTTAYDNFAIQAFKVNAVDYILKPIDRQELIAACEKAKKRIALNSGDPLRYNKQIIQLLNSIRNFSEPLKFISIPTLKGFEIVKAEDILYVKGDGNYSNIIIKNKSPILISKTVKYMEKKLEEYSFFFRIHSSSIINLNEINQYFRGEGGYVVMSDGKTLNVARHRRKLFLKKLEHRL